MADPETKPTPNRYHEALGRFIEAFSTTEAAIQMLLWHYAKVDADTGRSIFSGVRPEQAISFIKRLVTVKDPGEPLRSDLDDILAQLQAINNARNEIVHFTPLGGLPTDVRELTNELRAYTASRRRTITISIAHLDDMTSDLMKIGVHVGFHWSYARDAKQALSMFAQVRARPWQYKRPAHDPRPSP